MTLNDIFFPEEELERERGARERGGRERGGRERAVFLLRPRKEFKIFYKTQPFVNIVVFSGVHFRPVNHEVNSLTVKHSHYHIQ